MTSVPHVVPTLQKIEPLPIIPNPNVVLHVDFHGASHSTIGSLNKVTEYFSPPAGLEPLTLSMGAWQLIRVPDPFDPIIYIYFS